MDVSGFDDACQAMLWRTHHLTTLPPETKVYPGHGPATTLAREWKSNPYLQDDDWAR